MTNNTNTRTQRLAALADKIVLAYRGQTNRQMALDMAGKCDAHYETCKRHIVKAIRRVNGEVLPSRGGKRAGAGNPNWIEKKKGKVTK